MGKKDKSDDEENTEKNSDKKDKSDDEEENTEKNSDKKDKSDDEEENKENSEKKQSNDGVRRRRTDQNRVVEQGYVPAVEDDEDPTNNFVSTTGLLAAILAR